MARYADLKRERDEAVERAVIAERNSQIARVLELEEAVAYERARADRLNEELLESRQREMKFRAAINEARHLLIGVL